MTEAAWITDLIALLGVEVVITQEDELSGYGYDQWPLAVKWKNRGLQIYRPEVVVLDPPRSGCAPGVLQTVVERIAPPQIVYVSCNPEALVTDLGVVRKAGYEVERVDAIDMFPHTDHIEAVATIRR